VKKCSASLAIKELQIKTTLTPVTAIIKTPTCVGEDVEKKEP
jgi:hypothetical protein